MGQFALGTPPFSGGADSAEKTLVYIAEHLINIKID
jgi:hypothetical protein